MAITIKELLAADTISQAADKINFNFDQLLLNGGGPVGPSGPFGPPGPIGGRGIRGSQWFDGSLEPNDPSIVFPPLEPNDMYLEGPVTTTPTADGDVWEFNGTTWIWTGINLKGDKGDPGTSADWGTFGQPLLLGQEALYPVQETSITTNVRSVVIGGIPDAIWVGAPPDPNYVIDDSKAVEMNNEVLGSSVYIHVPTSGTAGITFSGGDATEDFYMGGVSELATIGLWNGDQLVIKDNKNSGDIAYGVGLRFESDKRDINVTAARGINISSANDAANAPGWTSSGDLTLLVNNSAPFSSTELVLQNSSSTDALMKVGTDQPIVLGPVSYQGNIIGEAKNVAFTTSANIILFANGGSSTAIQLEAQSGGIDVSAQGNIAVEATAGQINIDAPANNIFIAAGGDITIDATLDVIIKSLQNIYINTNWSAGGVGIGFTQPTPIQPMLAVRDNIGVGSNAAATTLINGSIWAEDCVGIGNGTSGLPQNFAALSVRGNSVAYAATQRFGALISLEDNYTGTNSTYGAYIQNWTPSDNGGQEKYGLIVETLGDNGSGGPEEGIFVKMDDGCGLYREPGIQIKGIHTYMDVCSPQTGIVYGQHIDINNGSNTAPVIGLAINTFGDTLIAGSSAHQGIFIQVENDVNGFNHGINTSLTSTQNNNAGYAVSMFNCTGFSNKAFKASGRNLTDSHGLYIYNFDYNYIANNTNIGDQTSVTNLYADKYAPEFALCVTADKRAADHTSPSLPTDWPCLVHFHNVSGSSNSGNLLLSSGAGLPDMSDWAYVLFAAVNSFGTIREEQGKITGDAGGGVLYLSGSDARLKTKIIDLEDGLDIVMGLKPRKFEWKKAPGVERIGLIAQEVHKIAPQYVGGRIDDEKSQLGIDYGKLTPLLIGAVQQQQQMIEEKDERIKSLEDRLKLIEEKLGL